MAPPGNNITLLNLSRIIGIRTDPATLMVEYLAWDQNFHLEMLQWVSVAAL